jgi:DNA-binding transcriptional LysR family regulator
VQLAELRNRKYDFVLARIVRPLNEEEDVNVEVLFNDQLVIAADAHSLWARRHRGLLVNLATHQFLP